MRCVAPQNPSHDWASCYSLMLESVNGYNLDLGSCSQPETGWPALQVQLLQELVGTSRKMGAHAASTRHMTFLFQVAAGAMFFLQEDRIFLEQMSPSLKFKSLILGICLLTYRPFYLYKVEICTNGDNKNLSQNI